MVAPFLFDHGRFGFRARWRANAFDQPWMAGKAKGPCGPSGISSIARRVSRRSVCSPLRSSTVRNSHAAAAQGQSAAQQTANSSRDACRLQMLERVYLSISIHQPSVQTCRRMKMVSASSWDWRILTYRVTSNCRRRGWSGSPAAPTATRAVAAAGQHQHHKADTGTGGGGFGPADLVTLYEAGDITASAASTASATRCDVERIRQQERGERAGNWASVARRGAPDNFSGDRSRPRACALRQTGGCRGVEDAFRPAAVRSNQPENQNAERSRRNTTITGRLPKAVRAGCTKQISR